jgi:Fe-S cluster biogenesis protein NfuA
MKDKEFQQRLQKIEGLVRTIESAADPNVRTSAVELMKSLMELNSAGIERMMDITFETGEIGKEIIDRYADDALVSNLLLLYGLHPLDIESRVLQALDKVRPYLRSHGGNVELLGIADGIVRLRLEGSCNGCASSAMTLKLAIEEAIYEAAPDVISLDVEGVKEQASTSSLVQLGRSREKICDSTATVSRSR